MYFDVECRGVFTPRSCPPALPQPPHLPQPAAPLGPAPCPRPTLATTRSLAAGPSSASSRPSRPRSCRASGAPYGPEAANRVGVEGGLR